MLYPRLFKLLEAPRWNMATSVQWGQFDASLLSDEQALTIKLNAVTEWAALPATEMFLRDHVHDSDFSAFMSIWFYEEQKHALVLMEYLSRFRPDLAPSEEELHAVRFPFDPAPPNETLALHFCGEIRLHHWYRCASLWHTEPVIRQIYSLLSQDEARHGACYLRYMQRAIGSEGDSARLAFAKTGLLMAGASRSAKAIHPTNLHVNQSLYPRDTVQSRTPSPGWMEHWLDNQICFNSDWERKVCNRILHNLSHLFGVPFNGLRDLMRYRRALDQKLSAQHSTPQEEEACRSQNQVQSTTAGCA